MKENVLSALGVQGKEDVITNLLAYCINESQQFARIFLESVCLADSGQYSRVKAVTRVATGESGVPDLIIAAQTGKATDLFLIENKLKADEGKDQTIKYATEKCITAVQSKVVPVANWRDARFTLLTLFPDQRPQSQDFGCVTYRDLLQELHNFSARKDSLANQLLRSLQELCSSFYSCGEVGPDDAVLKHLALDDDLGGSYLCFREVFGHINFPSGLSVERFGRESRPGRRYYFAIVTKSNWHPDEMVEQRNGMWLLNPERSFHVHLEPQWDVLNKKMRLLLHYELWPYRTKAQLKCIERQGYKDYQARRRRFIDWLGRLYHNPDFVLTGDTNQIGRWNTQFPSTIRLSEFQQEVLNLMGPIVEIIDEILLRLQREDTSRR